MNTYCDQCKCWHRPDGTKAKDEFDTGEAEGEEITKPKAKPKK